MNPIRLELTPEQFAALGSHTPGPRKALSPLPPWGLADPYVDQQLLQAGLLASNQQISEPYGSCLSSLGKTEAVLDLHWTEAGEPKCFSLYAPKTVDSPAAWAPTWAAEVDEGRVLWHSPFTRQDLEGVLQPVLETGETRAPKLEIGLSAPQALVLSALMDCQSPQNAVEGQDGQVWNASRVLGGLQGSQDPYKLSRYFSVPLLALVPVIDWNLSNVQIVLNSLVRMGLCSQPNQEGYALAEPMQTILAGFAGSGRLFWLSIRRAGGEDELEETEVEQVGFCASGTNLVFAWSNGSFQLKTCSRAEMTGQIVKEIFPAVVLPVQSPVVVPPVYRPVVLPPVQRQAAPAAPMTAAPVIKKRVPIGLIAGLVGVGVVACVLVVVGLVLLMA
jgi:hypothetical protein